MKLTKKERDYLMKFLEAESHRYNAPRNETLLKFLKSDRARPSDHAYWDRADAAKLNKAKMVAGIIAKINGCA